MPLFISDDEFRLIAHDASAVAERADAFIRDARRQLDTVRAEADAASIAAEQTCSLLEQKYSSLYSEFSRVQSENSQLSASLELRLSEVADAQAEKHQLHLKAIGKDGVIERLSVELAELQKGKRQLLELVEQKDTEIQERNATIQSFLDKIVNLTESNSSKEARVREIETELGRCHAMCSRIAQEKELLEKHNSWLNEELSAKVNSLVELRRKHMDVEADLSSKLADQARQLSESSNSLKRSREQVHELELRVNSLEEELRTSKEGAAANEQHFAAELLTVTKLVELYKASSEEWSKKAGELEGVIKALETHLVQTENNYKLKLEKEISVRDGLEKEAADLRGKLEKCEVEIENMRKDSESNFLPLSSFRAGFNSDNLSVMETGDAVGNDEMIVPRLPVGISGTALATSLLRDGWSLAKMYAKYQEANDAFLHERLERRKAEMTLKQVFHEIEAKVEMILDERAEHQRMTEAYAMMDQKLQSALSEHNNLENTIRQLKAELKMSQRDYSIAQNEINDLQKQVTVLLKECQDVQLRCGGNAQVSPVNSLSESPADLFGAADAERIISEQLLTFKDINGLVEQNVHLRRLVHSFSIKEEKRDAELREDFQIQLQKVSDDAAAKVEAVLKRSEEQASMIESLHSSVAMYKRLYEEERKDHGSSSTTTGASLGDGKTKLMVVQDGSQEVLKKSYEQLSERTRLLEEELATVRSQLLALRSERDKMALEADFARARLDSFMKEFDHQRQEANAVAARNVELTHLIVDYQRRLRESSDSLQSSEENSRKLLMEVSILKHEREILKNSESRASDEVRSLSQRVYRLQSSLDTIQSAEEVRENAKAAERRKLEDHLKQVEVEWAVAKKELQEERDRVRALTLDKEKAVENSMRQVEEMRRELSDAWRAVASAESRAAVAEARCSDLQSKFNQSGKKVIEMDGQERPVVNGEVLQARDEIEKLKEEARVNKEYMLQYKQIAQTNEIALKQIESAHEQYRVEAEKAKKSLEDEIHSLQNKVSEMERNYSLKSEECALAIESRELAVSSSLAVTSNLKEDLAGRQSQIEALEIQVSSLKEDLDMEHKRWRTAQDNYERQIVLQSETIQELMSTSKELSMMQSEMAKLRELSEAHRTENDILKKSWKDEKAELERSRSEAERKYVEVNEQNKILLDRLEALHIRMAEKEQFSSGLSSQIADSQEGSDLQSVISYLRRSKDIAEIEMTLLKQEKLRLQSQLDVALKAAEDAQASLRSQSEKSRMQVFEEEEFKSLQLQVREINLLRESNVQLRAENKHNFEECQKFRGEAQKAKMEAEKLGSMLSEKEVELNACHREIEMLKGEIRNLNNSLVELRENTRSVDIEEYERMKDELQRSKIRLQERESELELKRNLLSEKEVLIMSLEQDLKKYQSDLAEHVKKLNEVLQAEVNARTEIENKKRHLSALKKRSENLTKDKEELLHKNQDLQKQLEDSRSRKNLSESSSEQAKKEQEKDSRIQTLERALEKHKDDLKKERDKRKTLMSSMVELAQKIKQDRKHVEEEITKHKNAIVVVLERTAAQLPSGSNLDDQTLAYFQSVGKLEESLNSIINESGHPLSVPTESPNIDANAASLTGRQTISHLTRPSVPQANKAIEERAKGSTLSKPSSEGRKGGRRLMRPRLERPAEPSVDSKISGTEPTSVTEGEKPSRLEQPTEPSVDAKISGSGPASVTEGEKPSTSHEPELPSETLPDAPSARKRVAPPLLEPGEETIAQEKAGTWTVPLPKKPKNSEASEGSSDVPPIYLSPEKHDTVQKSVASDLQQVATEDMETEQPALLSNDDIADEVDAEEDVINVEEGEEQKETVDGTIQEHEVSYEGDLTMDELSEKPNTMLELGGESPKGEDNLVHSVADSEDEREEGELMPDDEDFISADVQNDSIMGDGVDTGDDGVDATEDASLEVPGEKIEADATEHIDEASEKQGADNTDPGAPDTAVSPQRSVAPISHDHAAPDPAGSPQRSVTLTSHGHAAPDPARSPQRSVASDNNNQAAPDPAQSPQRSVAVREVPLAAIPQISVSERRSPSPSPSTVIETEESTVTRGRTINLTARARENARLRQQQSQSSQPERLPTATPPRGRGRGLGPGRRDGARGSRGRGGRG